VKLLFVWGGGISRQSQQVFNEVPYKYCILWSTKPDQLKCYSCHTLVYRGPTWNLTQVEGHMNHTEKPWFSPPPRGMRWESLQSKGRNLKSLLRKLSGLFGGKRSRWSWCHCQSGLLAKVVADLPKLIWNWEWIFYDTGGVQVIQQALT
jgi:hypothetical protein